MSRKRKKREMAKQQKSEEKSSIGYLIGRDFDSFCVSDYIPLDKCPEIVAGVNRIAELIGSMTIHLMANTATGDVRIHNELSRLIDIDPTPTMTRKTWMTFIVSTMLLHGRGNAVVWPHTRNGFLQSLEPISADRISIVPREGTNRRYYDIYIDGVRKNPENLCHFVYNPDKFYPWMGRGIEVPLREIAKILNQARATEQGFMKSKWKPALIVKVDSNIQQFGTPEGRQKILEDYVKAAEIGEPWLIPGEQFQIEQVKPLTLADLAINSTVELDRRSVASVLGIPAFVLGVGTYNSKEWNSFIQNTIGPIATAIQQELTKKLIISERWYLKLNLLSLMNWDIQSIYTVFGGLRTQGVVTGNEVRDKLGMSPLKGLDELVILENYIPSDKVGDQEKLKGGKGSEEEEE